MRNKEVDIKKKKKAP